MRTGGIILLIFASLIPSIWLIRGEPILSKERNGVFLFNRLIEKCDMTREMIILIEEYNLNFLSLRRGTGVFQPPPKNRVPDLMKDFALWLNSDRAHELYPVLLSGISHYEFVRIHPFVDGNGRTARTLATLILYLKGFDTKKFFALDDYYNEDRERYYAALQTVDQKTLDITLYV